MSHFVGSLVHAPSSPLVMRVVALAAAEGVLPAEALLLERGSPRVRGRRTPHRLHHGSCRTVWPPTMSATVSSSFIAMRAEGLSNVPGGGQRIRVAVGPLRVHVDQAHLHGAEGIGELPVAAVALVSEPGVLRAPEDLVGLPDVLSPEAEAERLEPHRFQGTVAGEDDQIGPGDLPAVLLLDRPEQPARLVEARVVGPAVEGGEALGAARRRRPGRRRCGTCRRRATSSG